MQLVVAEKPSVARDIARVLGVRATGRASLEGAGRVITWCVGHLVELDEPAAYDPRWKPWRLDTLPMIPARFRLRPVTSSRDQLRVVSELLGDGRFTEVVNGCDAGREGELIFRYVYELAGCRLPVRRLWISSMTDEAIRAASRRCVRHAVRPAGGTPPAAARRLTAGRTQRHARGDGAAPDRAGVDALLHRARADPDAGSGGRRDTSALRPRCWDCAHACAGSAASTSILATEASGMVTPTTRASVGVCTRPME